MSLCRKLNLKKVHIHKALDPAHHYIAVDRRFQYDFSYSSWLPEKADLIKLISKAAYYVAPRKHEGIGMSFLDAMAMGRCVIAPNYPTMNEYIDVGINGVLYDYENPKDIIVHDVRKVQKSAYQSVMLGYEKWLKERYRIIEWIEEDDKSLKSIYIKYQTDETVKRQTVQEQKYYSYYMLMNKWLVLKNKKISLKAWFYDEAICHIAIYGYSEMAARLAEELEETSVYIDCYIDRDSKWTEDGRRTITLNQFALVGYIILVTSFYYYDEIKELIESKFSVRTISINEIVDDLLRKL